MTEDEQARAFRERLTVLWTPEGHRYPHRGVLVNGGSMFSPAEKDVERIPVTHENLDQFTVTPDEAPASWFDRAD